MSKSTRPSSSTAALGCSARNDSSSRASVSALRSVTMAGIYMHNQCAAESASDEMPSLGDGWGLARHSTPMLEMVAAVPLIAQQNLIDALRPILRMVEAARPVVIAERP